MRTTRLRASGTLNPLSRSGVAAASSASAAAANASSVAGPPRSASSAAAPATAGAPLRPSASRTSRTTPSSTPQRRRDADQGEGERGPVPGLAVARAARPSGGRSIAVISSPCRSVVSRRRVVAGQPVQLGDRDLALAVGPEHPDDGVEREHRHRHVGRDGWPRRCPGPRGLPEDRVVAVHALERAAAAARRALVAGLGDVGEVAAAGALQQVARRWSPGCAAARRRRPAAPGPAPGSARAPAGRRRGRRSGTAGADPQPAVGQVGRPRRRSARRTSTSTSGVATPSFMRSTRLVPPPRKAPSGRPGQQRHRRRGVAGPLVAELPHRRTPSASATAATAGTMLA